MQANLSLLGNTSKYKTEQRSKRRYAETTSADNRNRVLYDKAPAQAVSIMSRPSNMQNVCRPARSLAAVASLFGI